MPDEKSSQDPAKQEMDKKTQEEMKKKIEQMKSKVESFQKKIVTKHKKELLGICILPPEKFEDIVKRLRSENLKEDELRKRLDEEKKKINVLVLLEDQELKTPKEKISLIKKAEESSKKIASEIDKSIRPQCMLMSEIREACYDGKFEMLRLLSTGVQIYDPKDVLGAIKVSEIHKTMVLNRFEKYIVSYIAVGSLFRGDATSHDIDVAIIVDDTDVKRMSRADLKNKLMSIIRSMGYEASDMAQVKKQFHIQVYILTDFWDGIRDATPVFFTFLRDGIPLYDRGVFMPQKLLLNMGRIKPSPESIEMHMDVGERLLDRAKGRLIGIVVEDLHLAVINPSQSALMLQGYPPSTPKETIKLMDEIFVNKEKLLKQSDVDVLKRTFKLYKDIEHGTVKEVTGKEIDTLMKDISEYVKKIKKIVKTLEKKSIKNSSSELIDSVNDVLRDIMKMEGLPTSKEDLMKNFSKLVKKEHFSKKEQDLLKKTLEDAKKVTSKEKLEKLKRESSQIRKKILHHVQSERGKEISRARIRVKYGNQFGDIYLLDSQIFMVGDIDAHTKAVSKAKMTAEGKLGKIQASSLEELEKTLSTAKIPPRVFIKEALFEDLKKIFGKDVEILVTS
tara:strand:- start:62 stop:1915 length:1854 start_codon:yes stop_codon:yes gene_type:complete